ncbi:MAG: hypothetical protein HYZ53_11945 [Planctomycetes bacterium]|nr:hypothetical protein [Planctomycetota bacterium]
MSMHRGFGELLMRLACRLAVVFGVVVAGAAARADGGAAGAGAKSFGGAWVTTYGEMTLAEDGGRVTGRYQMGNEPCTIEGKVEGARLTFVYREPDAEGEGWFELAADGKTFSGKWRPKGEEAWQPWVGKRGSAADGGSSSFAGVWNTTWGKMRLVEEAGRVHGLYSYTAASTLAGEVKEKRLTFQYKEPKAAGEGWFELSKDGDAFAGKWRATGEKDWKGWEGTRVRPVPAREWLIIVEARWEGSLAEREYSFGDMLRAFFARLPNVEVRQRFFDNKEGLRKWCLEATYLAEPVVLLLATHGTPEGVTVGDETIGGKEIAESLRYASNLRLLHFSACLAMKDKLAVELLKALGKGASFPVSGYTTEVDWAASAITEFLYLELILTRGLTPEEAAEKLKSLLPFSGDKRVAGAPFDSLGFRILKPEDAR